MTRPRSISCDGRPKAQHTSRRCAPDRSCWAPPACSRVAAPPVTGRRSNLLSHFGAIPTHERVVVDGKIITAAGVASGIDFALALAALLDGETVAREIQLQIEYDPAPPFDSGSPRTAAPDLVERVKKRGAKLSVARAEAARRAGEKIGQG
jgi:hypothetical protein